jgi:hypothetical protein
MRDAAKIDELWEKLAPGGEKQRGAFGEIMIANES